MRSYQQRIDDEGERRLGKLVPNRANRSQICYTIFFMVSFLVLSVAFYMVASIDGSIFGTPEGEIDDIIQDKMKGIFTVVEQESASDNT